MVFVSVLQEVWTLFNSPPYQDLWLPSPDGWSGGKIKLDFEGDVEEVCGTRTPEIAYIPTLFAIHEIPQSSLGFSPFELLHRRQLWGILDCFHKT